MGCQVDIVEDQDGQVRIRHKGRQLRAGSFDKEGHVRQAAIVDNKLLSSALHYAKQLQEQRDASKLSAPSTTKRDKRLLRAKQRQARAGDAFHASPAPL
jgi:hypothetical protein